MSTEHKSANCSFCEKQNPANANNCEQCGSKLNVVPGLETESCLAVGNTINKGYVAEYDDWLLFSNRMDKERLYRIRYDGTGLTKISDDQNSLFINVVSDFVYYSNPGDQHRIYRVGIGGNKRILLHKEIGVQYLTYSKGWFYYQSYSQKKNICKISIDGKERVSLNSDASEHLNVVGDWVYYINVNDGNRIYRVRKDGSERSLVGNNKAFFLNVVDGWIYFSNADRGYHIYRMQIDGTDQIPLNEKPSYYLNVRGDWIYYCSYAQDLVISKVKVDGSKNQHLNTKNAVNINVACGWIFYHDKSDRKVHMVRDNGAGEVDFQDFVSGEVSQERLQSHGRVVAKRGEWPDIVSAATGHSHTLLLSDNGEVYSFGSCQYGQLGHGDRRERLVPCKIEGLAGVKAIAAGSHHSIVLLENGDVYSFGCGAGGQLGHGDRADRLKPTKIEGQSKAAVIEAGFDHSVIVTNVGETVLMGESADQGDSKAPQTEDPMSNGSYVDVDGSHGMDVEEIHKEKEVSEVAIQEDQNVNNREKRKVNVGGLVVTIPEDYHYSVDRQKTEGRLIVAMLPAGEDIKGFSDDFRNNSLEFFFIEKKAQIRDKIDIEKDCDKFERVFNSLPGKLELVKMEEQLLIFLSDLGINHQDSLKYSYFGFIVTEYGAVYVLKMVFNDKTDLGILKEKTINLLQDIKVRVEVDAIRLSGESDELDDQAVTGSGDQLKTERGKSALPMRSKDTDNYLQQKEGKIEYKKDFPVTVTPSHLCVFYKTRHGDPLTQECIHNYWEKGVELSMVALRLGIRTPPYDLKSKAWDISRVFRVSDAVFNKCDDREVEIQRLFLKCVSYLSALRSFAWTLKGYVDRVGLAFTDVPIKDILAISDLIQERRFLNYTEKSFFPALCGVADIDVAYIPCSPDESQWEDVCKMSGCKSCGDLFALRSELTELYPVMATLGSYLKEQRKDLSKPLCGLLSDILYAWCSISLAADKPFKIIEGPVNYEFPLFKGGSHNLVMPYAKDLSSSGQKLINEVSSFNSANVEGTYFEIELVESAETDQALSISNLQKGDQVKLERKMEHPDNKEIVILNQKGETLGGVPKENATVLAPALDKNLLHIISAEVLSIEEQPDDSKEVKNLSARIAVKISYYARP